MRFIERSLEYAGGLLTCAALAAAISSIASCVLDETHVETPADVGVDAGSTSLEDASGVDAPFVADEDASVLSPHPQVTCPSTGPCARALRAPADAAITPVAEAFCALLSSGKVVCWGTNVRGELGRGAPDPAPGRPDFVAGLTQVKQLDRGCALVESGDVHCWGQVVVPGVSAGTSPLSGLTKLPILPAKKISMAGSMGCALLSNDRVTCFGRDLSSGQLDYAKVMGSDGGVYGPAEVPIGTGARIVDVGVGEYVRAPGGATYVVREDGTALSWGMNQSLGRVSSIMPDPSPEPIELADVRFLSAGGTAACGIGGGQVYCWGAPTGAPRPFDIYDAIHVAVVGPRPLGRGCAVLRNGDVYCWGDNTLGQAGDGTTAQAPFPVRVVDLPVPAVAVEVTMLSTCAVLVNGKVFCWGDGTRGQLGRDWLDGNATRPIEVVLPEVP